MLWACGRQWPTLASMQGKILFVVINTYAAQYLSQARSGLLSHPGRSAHGRPVLLAATLAPCCVSSTHVPHICSLRRSSPTWLRQRSCSSATRNLATPRPCSWSLSTARCRRATRCVQRFKGAVLQAKQRAGHHPSSCHQSGSCQNLLEQGPTTCLFAAEPSNLISGWVPAWCHDLVPILGPSALQSIPFVADLFWTTVLEICRSATWHRVSWATCSRATSSGPGLT